jgi:heat shock protein HslJ
MKRKMIVFGLILAAMTVSCRTQKATEVSAVTGATPLNTGESAASDVRAGLVGGYWKLTELSGEPVAATPGRATEAHLVFGEEENSVYGSGGCNSFRGSCTWAQGDRIRFSRMISTRKMCVDGMDTEDKLMQVFQSAEHYVLIGDTLVLNGEGAPALARFIKQ